MTDEPRLLAPSELHTRLMDDRWYTSIPGVAMRGEPEALSKEEHERHVEGRRVRVEQQTEAVQEVALEMARRLLSLEERVTMVQLEAHRRRVDVSSEVRLMRLMLVSGKEARHVEARVVVVERRVYQRYAA